jgi:hypothetical protein
MLEVAKGAKGGSGGGVSYATNHAGHGPAVCDPTTKGSPEVHLSKKRNKEVTRSQAVVSTPARTRTGSVARASAVQATSRATFTPPRNPALLE